MLAMLLLGVVLLGVVVSQTDLSEVWQRLRQVGPWAAAGILAAFLLGHLALAASWQLTLPSLSAGLRTLWRAWRVLMVGSALESVTPLAGLGGDPVKAILLKRHYGISYTEATASLVLAAYRTSKTRLSVLSAGTNARAFALLDTIEPPFFLFLHYWDVHYDYIPPAPYATRFDPDYAGAIDVGRYMKNPAIHVGMDPRDLAHVVALYDGEIAWVDRHLGELLDELRRRGLWDDTVVVLTSDHGDEFFEHGEKGHQHSLYQELLHVPLIVRLPGVGAGRRVTGRVELIDVMPTVLEAVGLPVPAAAQGRSLLPWIRGEGGEPRPAFAETTKARKTRAEERRSAAYAVIDGSRKLIVYEGKRYPSERYDLERDPGERHDLGGAVDDVALAETLDAWLRTAPRLGVSLHDGLDEETLRSLRSLGYLGDE